MIGTCSRWYHRIIVHIWMNHDYFTTKRSSLVHGGRVIISKRPFLRLANDCDSSRSYRKSVTIPIFLMLHIRTNHYSIIMSILTLFWYPKSQFTLTLGKTRVDVETHSFPRKTIYKQWIFHIYDPPFVRFRKCIHQFIISHLSIIQFLFPQF